jgi:pimeloyl-ACP methyl ester carboxylesterase
VRNYVRPSRLALLALVCPAAFVGPVRADQPPPGAAHGIVFVANGSGDYRTVTRSLVRAVAEERLPLAVETVNWSHGYGRYVLDHVDHRNQVEAGRCLAAQVAAYRRYYPWLKIHLIGHSAGCAVVLAAAEQLPPNTIDRIVLLAPSVSPCYDLRPALASAREGIDVFISDRDKVILGLAMRVVGTADRRLGPAAGQVGFRPVVGAPTDAALYTRLRLHHWDPVVAWSGHAGGHYGSNRVGFLKAYVLPLLAPR